MKKEELAEQERKYNKLDGFWDRINNDQYHFVLKAKGNNSTLEKVKEFLTRNHCRIKYKHLRGDGYYPLIESGKLRLFMQFFSQWYKKPLTN